MALWLEVINFYLDFHSYAPRNDFINDDFILIDNRSSLQPHFTNGSKCETINLFFRDTTCAFWECWQKAEVYH